MSLKSQIIQDSTNVFLNTEEFADIINYNGAVIKSVIEIGADRAKGNDFSSNGSSARAIFWVAAVDIECPTPGDMIRIIEMDFLSPTLTVDISVINWSVAKILESGGGMHALECTSSESVY